MNYQIAALGDTVYFPFAALDTAGSGADGATPAAHVRLCGTAAGAAPVYSPTPALLSHATYPAGAHEVAVAATSGNGFAAGNHYTVYCTLAVDGQNPTGAVGQFFLTAADSDQLDAIARTLTALPAHAAGGTAGLALHNGEMDLVDAPNPIAVDAFSENIVVNADALAEAFWTWVDSQGKGRKLNDFDGLGQATWAVVLSEALGVGTMGKLVQDMNTVLGQTATATILDAVGADVNSLLTALTVRIDLPQMLQRPATGSIVYRIWVTARNPRGLLQDLAATPTVTMENGAGTSRTANLGTVTKLGGTNGMYYVDYTVSAAHAIEELVCSAGGISNGYPTGAVAATFVGETLLTAQGIRDAAKLAPTAGAPAAGSTDADLDTLTAGVNVTQMFGDNTAAENLALAYGGTGYAGGTIKQQVNVVAVSGDTTAADNLELAFDGTGYAGGTIKQQVDAVAVSGDSGAAENLEAAFDGTGYVGGTIKQLVEISDKTGYSLSEAGIDAILDEEVNSASATANSLRGAAKAAWAQGMGRWVLSEDKTTLTLYGTNGSTVVRTFTIALDAQGYPISRTPA
jgi:hypothetical protein